MGSCTTVKWKSWPVQSQREPCRPRPVWQSGCGNLAGSGWTARPGLAVRMCPVHCWSMDGNSCHRHVPQEDEYAEIAFLPKLGKDIGDAKKIGEPLRCSVTLARLGPRHPFVHLCRQQRLQARVNSAHSFADAAAILENVSRDSLAQAIRHVAAVVFSQAFCSTWRRPLTPSQEILCGQQSLPPQN